MAWYSRRRTRPGRAHARQEERLVGVDVPHPRHHRLVEQEILHGHRALPRGGKEQFTAHLQSIHTQAIQARAALPRRQPEDLPELAHVAHVHRLSPVLEVEVQVGVDIWLEALLFLGGEGGPGGGGEQAQARGRLREELSRHTQVQQQARTVVQAGHQVLAPALQGFDAAAPQRRPQFLGRGEEEVAGVGGMEISDAPAHHQGFDALARGLDLGEFRHCGGHR